MAKPKLDAVTAGAVDLARSAAVEAGGEDGVGEHLGVVAEEGERLVTHLFESTLAGYADWHWAVTLVRASRAKEPTVNEAVLLPTPDALLAPAWVPWADRIGPGDIAPGTLMPTPGRRPAPRARVRGHRPPLSTPIPRIGSNCARPSRSWDSAVRAC